MTDQPLSEVAGEAAVWGIIETEAKIRKDEARAELARRMGPETLAVKAVANGHNVGRASWVEGSPKLVVVDHSAFLAFVTEHYPDNTISTVNTAFQKTLFDNATVVGGVVVDRNGLPIPGVEYRTPEPYVAVKKSPQAREAVEALLAGSRLQLDSPEAVTDGD